MENKYYTPTIEEFCEGFQYEKRVNTVGEEVEAYFALDGEIVKIPNYVCTEEDWAGKEFSLSNSKEQDIEKLLEEGRLRVKYLDREDIEGFGFKHMGDDRDGKNLIHYQKELKDALWVIYDYRYRLNEDAKEAELPIRIFKADPRYWDNVFLGTIKNKHELKRVLTMLGIM